MIVGNPRLAMSGLYLQPLTSKPTRKNSTQNLAKSNRSVVVVVIVVVVIVIVVIVVVVLHVLFVLLMTKNDSSYVFMVFTGGRRCQRSSSPA